MADAPQPPPDRNAAPSGPRVPRPPGTPVAPVRVVTPPVASKPVPPKSVPPGPVASKVITPPAVPPAARAATPLRIVTPPAVPAKPATPVRVATPPAAPRPAPAPAAASPAAPRAAAPPAVPQVPVPAKPVAPVAVVPKPTVRPPPQPTGPDPRVGTQIARCKIIERVGVGRTSVVYRAHHEGLGKDVAIKILSEEVLQLPEVVAKFEQEARAIARLDHPNVLKIYDVVTEGETHGIVMEFLEGESVLEYIQHEKQVAPADALRVVRQAAAGLQAAHAKGIIHRDVKPQNLVILEDGTVKLIDFGLATAAGEDGDSKRIGTPHYMAPEACEARPVETASDVYSLGITLHHLLTGQPPYAGMSIKEILAAHIAAKPLQPEKTVRGLAEPLCELVRTMTKRDALMRPRAEQVVERVDLIGGEDLVKQQRLAPRRKRHGRRGGSQTPLAAVGLGAAVVVGILILVLSKGARPPVAPATPGPSTPPGPEAPETPSATPGPDAPPTPPVESEDARKAREAREAADRKAELEGRKVRAQKALDEVTEWARQHSTDKDSVVREYRVVARSYADQDAGKEAKRRADGIEKGTIHPHPDKVFSEVTAVEKAQAAWDAARDKVDEAISGMRYDDALHLIPNTVEDPSGKLSDELSLWRALTVDLTEFYPALEREAEAMKPAERTLKTPKGLGTVSRFTTSGPVVAVGTESAPWKWSELAPADVADLARRAFAKKEGHLTELLAAFAWAHRVSPAFYQAALALKMSAGSTSEDTAVTDRLLARADARFKPAPPK